MSERTRERIIELIQQMKLRTVDRGCTPQEAAGFAAKVAEWIERHQIDEAELRAAQPDAPDVADEVCQNKLRTGKKTFNPGMTAVVSGLSSGMCCKVILLHEHNHVDQSTEAVYGIVGAQTDADYVCQMATAVVPLLQTMGTAEGREHGYEKAGLVRWNNQYLTGAGQEIRLRLDRERKERADAKERDELQRRLTDAGSSEHVKYLPGPVVNRMLAAMRDGTLAQIVKTGTADGPRECTALTIITGETLAVTKRAATEEAFKTMYPKTRTTFSRSQYDHTANERGRAAGKRVGLHVGLEGS